MVKKAKYRILEMLEELSEVEYVTTDQLAEKSGLSRSLTSNYLSQLFDENLVRKNGKKPIYWQIIKKDDVFTQVIGYDKSLKSVVEECVASVKYPPNGLPILITGESGVGKSFLANIIFKYAEQMKIIESGTHIVTLNCADYANNPELLSSVLFGYKKGAFTGANEDTTGLLEKANGGYLFLDEVHRLQKENQEKLFTILDTGEYFPLGEQEKPKKVKIRLICATTESPENYLLETFRRRIPLKITLPNFKKRTFEEKILLVYEIFLNEARKLNLEMIIEENFFMGLVNQEYKGNIGELKNKIKILCAKEYSRNQSDNIMKIPIDFNQEIEKYIVVNNNNQDYSDKISNELKNQSSNELARLFAELERKPTNNNFFKIKNLIKRSHLQIRESIVEVILLNIIRGVLKEGILFVNRQYGVLLNLEEIANEDLTLLVYRVMIHEESNEKFTKDYHLTIQEVEPRGYYVITKLIEIISKKIDLTHTQEEMLRYLFLYYLSGANLLNLENINYNCILVSHGRNMSSSIQEVVNNLCGTYIFESFDMPIDSSVSVISEKVKLYIDTQKNYNKDFILLFDMGSLNQIYKEVKPLIESKLLAINNLTTPMALDIGLQVQQGKSFDEIAIKAEKFSKSTHIQYYEGISQNRNIIVSCMSGEGLAEEIKRIMKVHLHPTTEIITIDYKELKYLLETQEDKYFVKTKLIVTTTDIESPVKIPIVNIYNIMNKAGSNEFKTLLAGKDETTDFFENMLSDFLELFTLGGIGNRLKFLNPNIVIKEVLEIVSKYENYYDLLLDGQIKINLYMHIALMLERMLVSSRKINDEVEVVNDKIKEEFFSISKNIFHEVEIKYNLMIDNYELSLMFELLKEYIV